MNKAKNIKQTPTKKNGQPKMKTGRKLIPIDPKVVEGMARVGATDGEIGDFVGADANTIGRRFGELLTKSRSAMRLRLRQAQYKLAVEGNPTLCIWLGKQMLGQSDRQELSGPDGGPIELHDSKANVLLEKLTLDALAKIAETAVKELKNDRSGE